MDTFHAALAICKKNKLWIKNQEQKKIRIKKKKYVSMGCPEKENFERDNWDVKHDFEGQMVM